MDHGQENGLATSASAYLRSARHQPVDWMEWGAEAFARAQRENKPVLLDIGAVWCHWCHVMDRESYEDAATAALINENFIAVKVDRDERPDVDARYQAAVSSISGQGGWPLTAFLTPDGKPYFGGTYFPPDDRYGRPSFRRVLGMMADAFEDKPNEVAETAQSVMDAIEHNESFSGRAGDPGIDLLDKIITSAISQHDARNGGFGTQPKFPHPGALDLLIDAATRNAQGAEHAKNVAVMTLERMAAGGMYDQLAGGFHRYSVDDRWIVPHFEKMAYDNSELLKNYAHAYASFGNERFAEVARDILRWMDEWLSDREQGGFYASQDADDSLDDDGDYFTWTRDEAAAALTPEEFAVAAPYFNLRPVGDMHHNPLKNVLHIHPNGGAEVSAIARSLQQNETQTRALLDEAKRKLYAARLQRKTPYVDKTVYTGWNGMCIAAYFHAARALDTDAPAKFALHSLDRVLAAAWSDNNLAHVVAYGEGVPATTPVKGVLEDYAFLANAALDAWEWTGELRYFSTAKAIADSMIAKFCDHTGGAFFDAEHDPNAIGALITCRKPLQDAPTPAGNATAATLLLRLAALVNDGDYATLAQQTLETFAGVVEHFGLYAASYGLALRRAVEGPEQVCVVESEQLAQTAERPWHVNRSVLRLSAAGLASLPPALAETLPHVPGIGAGTAVVCRGNVCLPPVHDAEALLASLQSENVSG
jgi:uncharacterized protein YyaL (SSP411 family)